MAFWTGQALSLLGGQVTLLALPFLALSVLQVSAFQMGLLTAFASLPWLLVSLPAGVIVDRCRRRRVMLWCDIGRAIALASVPLAAHFSSVSLAQLYVVATIVGTFNVFFNSANLSTPPELVRSEQLTAANGMVVSAIGAAGLIGPTVAALLIGLIGPANAITVDVFSFLLSAVSILLVRRSERRPGAASSTARHFGREMAQGLRIIFSDRALMAITLANSLGNFLLAGMSAIMLLYFLRELDWSVHDVGVVMGVAAAGGLIGSLLTGWLVGRVGMMNVLVFGQILFGPAELVVVFVQPGSAGKIAAAAALAVALFCATAYDITQRSYRMQLCPPATLGRLNATISWLQWGLRPIAAIAAGALAGAIGARETIFIFGCLLPICPIVLWFSPLRKQADARRSSALLPERNEEESCSTPTRS